MPWTLDTMKVDECFNRVHLSLGWDSPTMGRWDEGDCYGGQPGDVVNYNYDGYDMKIMVMMVNC